MRQPVASDLELELAHARQVAVPALLWAAALVFVVGTALWERGAPAPAEWADDAPPAVQIVNA